MALTARRNETESWSDLTPPVRDRHIADQIAVLETLEDTVPGVKEAVERYAGDLTVLSDDDCLKLAK